MSKLNKSDTTKRTQINSTYKQHKLSLPHARMREYIIKLFNDILSMSFPFSQLETIYSEENFLELNFRINYYFSFFVLSKIGQMLFVLKHTLKLIINATIIFVFCYVYFLYIRSN